MDPSPLTQTAVYMTGIAAGYLMFMTDDEWRRAWDTIRWFFSKKSRR